MFFHELAHAVHGRVLGKLKGGQVARQEIVAELTAAVLMHLFGKRPNDGAAYLYIRHYAEEAGLDVYRACLGVLSDVNKCLDFILARQGKLNNEAAADQPATQAGPSLRRYG